MCSMDISVFAQLVQEYSSKKSDSFNVWYNIVVCMYAVCIEKKKHYIKLEIFEIC